MGRSAIRYTRRVRSPRTWTWFPRDIHVTRLGKWAIVLKPRMRSAQVEAVSARASRSVDGVGLIEDEELRAGPEGAGDLFA